MNSAYADRTYPPAAVIVDVTPRHSGSVPVGRYDFTTQQSSKCRVAAAFSFVECFPLADAEGNGDSTSEPITPWTGATIASVSSAYTLYIIVSVISERTRLNDSSAPIFTSPCVPLSSSCRV
ncbi:hypothetical protein M404DRAFT_998896 [Pisolithus tinctorius Marx 270]|uniref:Uncharacterized protein n=1 Tax=Pisolithus tinctorius Marx 270 TaxID=870435 RepID=A0A0C3KAZ7_PISTI|nr:hypothetical protein M404DRAFT_998896 [Pisolithus tinctorius Marx 270]